MYCWQLWLDIASKSAAIVSALGVAFAGFTYFHQREIRKTQAIRDLSDIRDEILAAVILAKAMNQEKFWDNAKTPIEVRRYSNEFRIHLGRTLLRLSRFFADYNSLPGRIRRQIQIEELLNAKGNLIDLAKSANSENSLQNNRFPEVVIPSELID